jgi:hypothetical protein
MRGDVAVMETHLVPMKDLARSMTQIRVWMYGGDEVVITYQDHPFIYMRPLREDDDVEGMEIITTSQLQTKRQHLLERISEGKSLVVSFHHRNLAIASPDVPDEALRNLEEGGARLKERLR